MGIFKAYDIRGTYPDQVNEAVFYKIGAAAAKVLAAKSVVVGRDGRTSSPQLHAAVIKGLLAGGADVIDIGLASTPMVYFAVNHCKCDAGVQVTASHNPGGYNGLKICRTGAAPVAYDSGLEEIEHIALREESPVSSTPGKLTQKTIAGEYLALLNRYCDGIKPLTVVVDAGNGVIGEFLPALFDKLPCELIPLFFEVDGKFPNHDPNPLDERNLRALSEKVVSTRADLGAAFDGDGDRVLFVDEKGETVPGDLITALLARDILRRHAGAAIIYDLRSSITVPEYISELGGIPQISRVGHSYIKELMRQTDAEFAGEVSGHFYFRELSYTDNAEMAMLTLFGELSRTGGKFSEIMAPLHRYASTGEINFTVGNPAQKISVIEKHYADLGGEIQHLDGISVKFAEWWFNIRPSNTEPMLRLNLEAVNETLRDAQRKEVEDLIFG